MNSFSLFVHLFKLCTLITLCNAITPEQQAQIVEAIQTEFLEPNFTPGVAFSVVYNEDVFASAVGLKDIEQQLSADSQSLFGIASVTKSFTATIVVKVLNDVFPGLGVSALDTPIRHLIPNYNFTMSDRYRFETLTFRDLLAHTTCLSTFFLGRTVGSIKDAQEFAYRMRFVKEVCGFRTGYTYNNGMYALAGDLIGAIANSTFLELGEDLLRQLGMTDTIIYKPSLNFDELPQASRGYYRTNGQTIRFNSELFKRMHVALPSGGLMASSRDLAKYMQFQLSLGKVDGVQIIPTIVMRRIRRSSNTLNLAGVEGDYAYALGLRLGIHDRFLLESHQGTWPPFTSRISLFPTLNLGIFTAVNGPGVLTRTHKSIHDRIFDIVTGLNTSSSYGNGIEDSEDITRDPDEQEKVSWEHSNVNVEPEIIQGLYGNPVHGEFTVTYNASDPNGVLYLRYGLWGTGYLRQLTGSNSTYYPLWDSDIVGDFLSQATQIPITTIDFGIENVAVLIFDGNREEFIRNGTLDTFPSPPWSPNSCAPQQDLNLSIHLNLKNVAFNRNLCLGV